MPSHEAYMMSSKIISFHTYNTANLKRGGKRKL
uniref:Uncharacterized protein n=1 Tax=Arundo donax TaxID=35708 RepID=A0A0A9B1W9_ARUDO